MPGHGEGSGHPDHPAGWRSGGSLLGAPVYVVLIRLFCVSTALSNPCR